MKEIIISSGNIVWKHTGLGVFDRIMGVYNYKLSAHFKMLTQPNVTGYVFIKIYLLYCLNVNRISIFQRIGTIRLDWFFSCVFVLGESFTNLQVPWHCFFLIVQGNARMDVYCLFFFYLKESVFNRNSVQQPNIKERQD